MVITNYTQRLVGKCHLLSETNTFCGTAARTEFYHNNRTNRLKHDGFDFVDGLCISNIDEKKWGVFT